MTIHGGGKVFQSLEVDFYRGTKVVPKSEVTFHRDKRWIGGGDPIWWVLCISVVEMGRCGGYGVGGVLGGVPVFRWTLRWGMLVGRIKSLFRYAVMHLFLDLVGRGGVKGF